MNPFVEAITGARDDVKSRYYTPTVAYAHPIDVHDAVKKSEILRDALTGDTKFAGVEIIQTAELPEGLVVVGDHEAVFRDPKAIAFAEVKWDE